MADVLLATCAAWPRGDEDAGVIEAALDRLGIEARWAVWTDASVNWDDALVVLRGTWDYTFDRPAFLRWVNALDRVANTADMVRWNTDKTYLRDLAAAGVPTVPTSFAAPGESVELPRVGEYVVKPSVGAGSRGAGRFRAEAADDAAAAFRHAASLHAAGRTVLLQPYLDQVDDVGETALIYLDGRFSHAVRKGPMLAESAAHDVHGESLFIDENITARVPDEAELAVSAAALALVRERFGAAPLYARVDLLPSPTGPVVIELELTEPSLFLGYGPSSGAGEARGDGSAHGAADPAGRFAAAVAARL